jgi:WhiB family redox-sensing transcriptional regulator
MKLQYLGWYDEASCRGMDGDIFFPEVPIGVNHAGLFDEAKKICGRCSVRAKCLEFAMEAEQNEIRRYGMFGGLTPRQRDARAGKR